MAVEQIQPTKKQRELLTFIEEFIAQHGYSPSYREIMSGKGYTSVASVALHINSLIKRGHLRKRDRSARSLEVVRPRATRQRAPAEAAVTPTDERWLVQRVDMYFQAAENLDALTSAELDRLYVLVAALRVLELDGAVQSFLPRLAALKAKQAAA